MTNRDKTINDIRGTKFISSNSRQSTENTKVRRVRKFYPVLVPAFEGAKGNNSRIKLNIEKP